jgi:hypothetical protein
MSIVANLHFIGLVAALRVFHCQRTLVVAVQPLADITVTGLSPILAQVNVLGLTVTNLIEQLSKVPLFTCAALMATWPLTSATVIFRAMLLVLVSLQPLR